MRDGEPAEAEADAALEAELSDAALAPQLELRLAPMTVRELDEVELIERVSFKEPWPAQHFLDELQKPFGRVDVATLEGRVLGFANYWLVGDEATVLAIAVHPDHRGCGYAGVLLRHLLDQARAAGCTTAHLEVRRGNAPALALYLRHGFAVTYTRKRYYGDGEDALVMMARLSAA